MVNGDPYRTPQPADRRVINRSGQAAYQRPEEPQPVADEPPKSAPRSTGSRRSNYEKEPSSKKGLWATIIIVVALLVLGGLGWLIVSNFKGGPTGIDTSKYQAVFMSNGQIYFGKLSDFNDASFKITSIYYPQAQATGEDEETNVNDTQSNIQLFRVTDGVHGPEDEMIITKDQILYYENLRSDSKVTQLIEQNKAQ